MARVKTIILLVLLGFIGTPAWSQVRCANLFSAGIDDAALWRAHKKVVTRYPIDSDSRIDTMPTLYFYEPAKFDNLDKNKGGNARPPIEHFDESYKFDFVTPSKDFERLVVKTLKKIAEIAKIGKMPLPDKLAIYVSGRRGDNGQYPGMDMLVLSEREMGITYDGRPYLTEGSVAHEVGHVLFEYFLAKHLPKASGAVFLEHLKSSRNLVLKGIDSSKESLAISAFETRMNELVAETISLVIQGRTEIKYTSENIWAPYSFFVTRMKSSPNERVELSSERLISSSPYGQHNVLNHMAAWLGEHRYRNDMTNREKARLIRTLLLTSVELIDEFIQRLKNGEAPADAVTTHEELVDANLKFYRTFLKIEKQTRRQRTEVSRRSARTP